MGPGAGRAWEPIFELYLQLFGPKGPNDPCSGQKFSQPTPVILILRGGKSDHGLRKAQTKTQTTPDTFFLHGKEKPRPGSKFLGKENSDHGLSLWCFRGRGRRGDSQILESQNCPPPPQEKLQRKGPLHLQKGTAPSCFTQRPDRHLQELSVCPPVKLTVRAAQNRETSRSAPGVLSRVLSEIGVLSGVLLRETSKSAPESALRDPS